MDRHEWTGYEEATTVANLREELFSEGRLLLQFMRYCEVIIIVDADRRRIFLGAERAGLWINPSTPANKFELVKGGFRIDIADRLVAMLMALGMSKSDDDRSSVVPQISGPAKQEK